MGKEKDIILIVDDIEMNRVILNELFKEDYIIYEASDGEEALDIICKLKDKIKIILLDIIMPKIDGFGVLEKMKELKL